MSIGLILFAMVGTAIVVYLVQQGQIPAPFVWVAYLVLIVAWIAVVLWALGFGGLHLGRV